MAITVGPSNLQKLEFDVTTAEGPSRVTVVTGMIQFSEGLFSSGPPVTVSLSLKTLLDPLLMPGQFRKATATASFARIVHNASDPSQPTSVVWSIDEVGATLEICASVTTIVPAQAGTFESFWPITSVPNGRGLRNSIQK